MKDWIASAADMLNLLLGQPGSALERWLIIALGIIVLLSALMKVGSSMAIPVVGRYQSLGIGVLGSLGMLAGMVLARDWLLPLIGVSANFGLLLVSGITVSLCVVVLVMGRLQRATVSAASVTWLMSLFFVALVVFAVGGLFDLLSSGSRGVAQTKSRTAEMDRLLNNR